MCGRGNRGRFKDKNGKDVDTGFDKWGGYMAAKRAKLLDQFHSDNVEKVSDIFSGVCILVNGLTHPPAAELKNLMAAHGGEYHMYQASSTTHIIASNLPNVKIKHLGAVPIVKPAWITESIALNKLLDYKRYLLYTNQSRLQPALKFPVVTKASTSECSNNLGQHSDEITIGVDDVEHTETNFTEVQAVNVNPNNINIEDGTNTDTNVNPVKSTSESKSTGYANTRVTKTASDPRFLEEFYSNSRLHLISTLGAEFKQLVGQLREKSDSKFPGREKLIAEKGQSNVKNNAPSSVVMHIDMDCFFVSVGLRNHPELKGQPVAITHAKSGVINTSDPNRQAIRDQEFALYTERLPEGAASRVVDIKEKIDGLASMSEIASCSYEARKYGIKNGMFLGQAIKLCPGLKTLPYDFEGYKEVSNTLYNTIASYTLDIEAVSCDEMYVDIKQILNDTGLTVSEWGTHIRNEIMTVTGCPCSTGFGANRLQARLATRKAKPAGQYYLKPEEVETYMAEISLADVPGVGRATLTKLRHLGYDTCGDLQNGSLRVLQSELGNKLGERIWEQAHGKDNKPLDFNHERKSVSAEINYGIRFKTKEECYNFLQSLADEVFSRLSDINMKARGLTLKLLVRAEGAPVETAKFLGHGVCDAISKSNTSNQIFSNAEIIYKEAKSIYDKLNIHFAELRGVGIQLTKLEKNAVINKALSNFLKQGAVKKKQTNTLNPVEPMNAESNKTEGKVEETSVDSNKDDLQSKCDESLESISGIRAKIDEAKQPLNNATISKSTVRDVFPNTKPRGKGTRGKRGRKQGTNKTIHTFLGRPRHDKAATTVDNDSNENQAELLQLRNQIDVGVLNELPEDIRNEIMKEYRFDIKPKLNATPQNLCSSTIVQTPAPNKIPVSETISVPHPHIWLCNAPTQSRATIVLRWAATGMQDLRRHCLLFWSYQTNICRNIAELYVGPLDCFWHRSFLEKVAQVRENRNFLYLLITEIPRKDIEIWTPFMPAWHGDATIGIACPLFFNFKENAKTDANKTPLMKRSPFANQSWEQVKQGIKIWVRSETEPASVDVEMLADHLRQLALDRRIEVLKSGFNFLHRTFADLSCSWHQAYFSFVNAVQQGMVARYGKVLYIETNFGCCRIT